MKLVALLLVKLVTDGSRTAAAMQLLCILGTAFNYHISTNDSSFPL